MKVILVKNKLINNRKKVKEMIKKLILKYKLRKANYKWIKVPKDIINKYRDTTGKNKSLSDDKVEFKIVIS